MTHVSSGYTLVELMVVIAIVAVLALAALPYFFQSRIHSKLNQVSTIVTSQLAYAQIQYNKSGLWPSATDFGYAATVDPQVLDNPKAAGDIFSSVQLGTWSPLGDGDMPNCNSYMYWQFGLDPTEFPGNTIKAGDNVRFLIGQSKELGYVIVGCDTTISGVHTAGGDPGYYHCPKSYTEAQNLVC